MKIILVSVFVLVSRLSAAAATTTTAQHNHKNAAPSLAHFDGDTLARNHWTNKYNWFESKYSYFLLCLVCGFCTCPWMSSRAHDLYQLYQAAAHIQCKYGICISVCTASTAESAPHTADTLMLSATVWRAHMFSLLPRQSRWWMDRSGWKEREQRLDFHVAKIKIAWSTISHPRCNPCHCLLPMKMNFLFLLCALLRVSWQWMSLRAYQT